MLPGPVFTYELLTTARRMRYFFLRFLYGAVLLVVIGLAYNQLENQTATVTSYIAPTWQWGRPQPAPYAPGEISVREFADFARGIFRTISFVLLGTVLLLTPAFVAGAITEEKQRKTLHYLLASQLTSSEIVLGKLLVRLLQLLVFLAATLPVAFMLICFGGISVEDIVITFGTAATCAFFLAAVTMVFSTYARKSRDAMIGSYLFVPLWLTWPFLMVIAIEFLERTPGGLLNSSEGWWVWSSNPILVLIGPQGANLGVSQIESFGFFAASHLGVGFFCVLWATLILRPVYRRQANQLVGRTRKGLLGWLDALRRAMRPKCRERPMLWKEVYVQRVGSGLVRWMLRFVIAIALVVVVFGALIHLLECWDEIQREGFVSNPGSWKRSQCNDALQTTSAWMLVIGYLGMAIIAAGSMTSEREEDSWEGLLTTELTDREIVFAKMLGALASVRWLLVGMVTLWLLAAAVGALHPIGLLFGIIELVAFCWFVVALGVRLSMWARTTLRASAVLITILINLNGGYFLMMSLFDAPATPFLMFMCTPFVLMESLMPYGGRDEWQYIGGRGFSLEQGDIAVLSIYAIIVYLGSAALLTFRAVVWVRAVRQPPVLEWPEWARDFAVIRDSIGADAHCPPERPPFVKPGTKWEVKVWPEYTEPTSISPPAAELEEPAGG